MRPALHDYIMECAQHAAAAGALLLQQRMMETGILARGMLRRPAVSTSTQFRRSHSAPTAHAGNALTSRPSRAFPAAAEIVAQPGLERQAQRLLVHPCHHEYRMVFVSCTIAGTRPSSLYRIIVRSIRYSSISAPAASPKRTGIPRDAIYSLTCAIVSSPK